MLGVLGALEPEIVALRDALERPTAAQLLGSTVLRGSLAGHELVVVRSGVGKVNAALATAALAQAGVTELIVTGTAGGIGAGVQVGDAVVATDLVQHDVDTCAFGSAPGQLLGEPIAWAVDPELSEALFQAAVHLGAKAHLGRIASGDQFVATPEQTSRIVAQFDALAVEMEGAAVAQAAAKLGVRYAVVRWISDTADAGASLDFPAFCRKVAQLDLDLIKALVAARPSGGVTDLK